MMLSTKDIGQGFSKREEGREGRPSAGNPCPYVAMFGRLIRKVQHYCCIDIEYRRRLMEIAEEEFFRPKIR